MKKKIRKAKRRVFRVVCVLGDGKRAGDCGHDHRTSMGAVRCGYEPRAYRRDVAAKLRVVVVPATGGRP